MRNRPTFDALGPELRAALARYVLEARRKDRGLASGQGWVSQSRGIADYLFCLGIMPSYLEVWIERRAKRAPLQVFEAGMGEGNFCRALLERYPGMVNAEGLRLTYSARLSEQESLRQRIGFLESVVLRGPFDLAISARGAFVYSLNSFAAVEELLRALRPGGIAYLDDAKLLFPKPWFRAFLAMQGVEVEVTRYERGGPYAYKLKRLGEAVPDLTPLVRRYLEKIDENRDEILKWGFDRTWPGSPLTRILSRCYDEAWYRDLTAGAGFPSTVPLGEREVMRNREVECIDLHGVRFVNDAYAENAEDLREALERWRDRRLFWVAGGADALRLAGLELQRSLIYGAVFFGKNRRELAALWPDLPVCLTGQELKDAAEKAYHLARPGDVVLFSPGLPADLAVHGSSENRAADFRRCLREFREMATGFAD